MSDRPRIATISLAGCFGCHMSLLDIDERLFELLELVDFDRSPLTDLKSPSGRCRIGLLEGGCASDENVAHLLELREKCDTLVSIGDCAINGDVPALRNSIPLRECFDVAYLSGPAIDNPRGVVPSDPELPLVLDRVYPCHRVVEVDQFVPGCPPPAEAIWLALTALLRDEPIVIPYRWLKYD